MGSSFFLRIEQGACLKEPWKKVTRRILTLRLSCVDQVQVDMLCQAHADKLVTISPKIKNLESRTSLFCQRRNHSIWQRWNCQIYSTRAKKDGLGVGSVEGIGVLSATGASVLWA